ncbi:MAG: putative lipopolysaccharide heptosyltransferase III [Gammaproteobacteria bacterium]|nr:putative lipopolysaccharide heptosyltransferase III [Gammaproteobacteria bacterium]
MINDAVDFHRLQRVLVVKLRHHGDVLLTSPVFSVLKKRYPHLALDVLIYHDTREMLSLHPDIDHIFTIDRGWKKLGLVKQTQNELALLKKLNERSYDLLIHLTEHWRGLLLKHFLKPSFAVVQKYARRPGRLWRKTFTHHYPAPLLSRHSVEKNLDALRRLGLYPLAEECGLVLIPGIAAENRIQALLREHGLAPGEFIHLHPASRWFYKTWEEDKTAALIDRIQDTGRRVVLTAAPAEEERQKIKRILAMVKSGRKPAKSAPLDLSGMLTLKELAALIAKARCMVGVDSVPMHMAAALGTPVVALFGPSSEIKWAPWRVRNQVLVSSRYPCRPCDQHGCGAGEWSECLSAITVSEVFAAINDQCSMTNVQCSMTNVQCSMFNVQ